MHESLVEVLFYLFDGILLKDGVYETDFDEMAEKLDEAGFSENNIHKAIDWFYELTKISQIEQDAAAHSQSIRIYSSDEKRAMGEAGQSFLSELLRCGIIDAKLQEKIIERVLAIAEPLPLDNLRWIVMIVIVNAGVEMTDRQIAWFLPEPEPILQ